MNDTKLKQALAKMLPDYIWWSKEDAGLRWKEVAASNDKTWKVLNTELLHLCQQVINNLSLGKLAKYEMAELTLEDAWQEHVKKLAKVKGIEI